MKQLNAGRRERLRTRCSICSALPARRLESVQTGPGESGFGQPDLRGPQRLFGAQPPDRREGRSAAGRRDRGGLVRGQRRWRSCRGCVAAASTAWTTGTSSTGWCESRARLKTTAIGRNFSHQPVPHGLGRASRDIAADGEQAVPGGSRTGGERGRGASR